MQRWLIAFASWFCLAPAMAAETRQFPYEAIVRADNTKVRCGRGKNFYATSELAKGTSLMVHRHDPGGWYMVTPPPGSFSLIAVEHVKVETPGTGIVTLPEESPQGAPVWVGSELTNDHTVRQRTLQSGDAVQILGEDVLQDATGTTRVYKISPPVREFRWVKGDFIVPRDADLRQASLSDPYSNPLATVNPVTEEEAGAATPDVIAENSPEEELAQPMEGLALNLIDRTPSPSSESPKVDSNDPRAALREIDRHYVEMSQLDPTQWDIEELVRSYEGLATSAPQLAGQIQKRLAALADRRQLHAEYRRFAQLTTETTRRDQQLASQVQWVQADQLMNYELGESAPLVSESQFASAESGDLTVETPASIDQVTHPARPSNESLKLNGAGIVQKRTDGRYALVSPDGRTLAFLQANANIPLHQVVGQPMGIIGQRRFDSRIGADLLIVQQMVPIQLQR